jgi:hypothetical protein
LVSNYVLINLCKQLEDSESALEAIEYNNKKKVAAAILCLFLNAAVVSNVKFKGFKTDDISGITGIALNEINEILLAFSERKIVAFKKNVLTEADTEMLKKIYHL